MSRFERSWHRSIIKSYVKEYEKTHNIIYLDAALRMKRWLDER